MRRNIRILLSFAMLSACAPQSASPDGKSLPADAVILPVPQISAVVRQCSRTSAPGGVGWQPRAGDIIALEAALPGELAKYPVTEDLTESLRSWRRQYVGLARDGHRYLYGNFFPRGYPFLEDDWRHKAVDICNSGQASISVELDIESRRFTLIARNNGGF
jgi:hypothetical protein